MSVENSSYLPSYQTFIDAIAVLELPISASELHGVMCGYLCAGASMDGEAYLRAFIINNKDYAIRDAARAMFSVYSISQQQLINFDFEFQLMLPEDHQSLVERTQAFSDWCDGFTQGMVMAGIGYQQLHDEEAQEALHHLAEFAQLNCETLKMDDDDEKALMEVSEYARMAVLRLYSDLLASDKKHGLTKTKH